MYFCTNIIGCWIAFIVNYSEFEDKFWICSWFRNVKSGGLFVCLFYINFRTICLFPFMGCDFSILVAALATIELDFSVYLYFLIIASVSFWYHVGLFCGNNFGILLYTSRILNALNSIICLILSFFVWWNYFLHIYIHVSNVALRTFIVDYLETEFIISGITILRNICYSTFFFIKTGKTALQRIRCYIKLQLIIIFVGSFQSDRYLTILIYRNTLIKRFWWVVLFGYFLLVLSTRIVGNASIVSGLGYFYWRNIL